MGEALILTLWSGPESVLPTAFIPLSSIIMGEVVQMHFTTVDYVIFALLLVASAGIGLFYAFSGGRQRTTQVDSGV